MIKFFRTIRQQLLSENKFRKYLLYAIGEIVLVVIGILIALSINNWNEDQKKDISNTKFLKNLSYEIELDKTVFTEKINNYEQINESLIAALSVLNESTSIQESDIQVVKDIIDDIEVLTPNFKNIERNDIKIADGTLGEINDSLNIKYQNYLERIKSNNEVISKFGITLHSIVQEGVYPKVDLDYTGITNNTVKLDLVELKNDRFFKNAINRSIKYRQISIYFMNEQKRQADNLLILINNELDKRKHNNDYK